MEQLKQILLQYVTDFGGLDKEFRAEFKKEARGQAWMRVICVSIEFAVLSLFGLVLTHINHQDEVVLPIVVRKISLLIMFIMTGIYLGLEYYLAKKKPGDIQIRKKFTTVFWVLFYVISIAITYSGVINFDKRNDLDFAVLVMLFMSVIGLFGMFKFWVNFAALGAYVSIVAHFIWLKDGNEFFYPYLTFCLIVCCIISAVQYSYAQRLFLEKKSLERVNLRLSALAHEAVIKANSASSVKDDFISRISHDMRTPMNGLMGLIHLTLQENLTPQVRDNVVKMDQTGKFLLSLINDTLDMRRIEEGDFKLQYEAVGSKDFINGINVAIQPSIREKKLNLDLSRINVPDCFAKLDRVRTQQIFMNIISNAVKFTPKGGKISIEIDELSRENNVAKVKFSISDNGIGINEQFLPHIFEPYAQEQPENSEYAGSGMGLAIVKLLVEAMNGTIEVESKQGVGTTVSVLLDFEIIESPENYIATEEENDVVIKGKHILVCEDNPLNSEIAKKLLEAKGAIVDCANNGKIGVEMFDKSEKGYYSLIFMDIGMPVMNGLEAARTIRGLRRNDAIFVPIVALSANSEPKEIDESLQAGMDDHIVKPFDVEELYETVRKSIILYKRRMNHEEQ